MMVNLVKSELLKVRSTQVWIWMLVLAIGFTALLTIGTVVSETQSLDGQPPHPNYFSIFTTPQGAGTALLVLGILGLSTEYRHKTITPTLLATPNRWRLISGKLLAYVLLAAAYSAVCIVVNFAIAIPWLQAKNLPVELGGDVPLGVFKAYLALVYAGLLGLGLGALIKNQAAAMVSGILYFAIIDGLWSVIPWIRRVWPFSPGGAVQTFLSQHGVERDASDIPVLSPSVGGLLMIMWVALLLVASTQLLIRRDVS